MWFALYMWGHCGVEVESEVNVDYVMVQVFKNDAGVGG